LDRRASDRGALTDHLPRCAPTANRRTNVALDTLHD
jgi:hypothetical protein